MSARAERFPVVSPYNAEDILIAYLVKRSASPLCEPALDAPQVLIYEGQEWRLVSLIHKHTLRPCARPLSDESCS